ncbi:MAG: ribosome maturation factor RimP [Bacillota bacterium]|nr:ribosome maturation factor RimP [Bacillota bacterium]
MPSKNHGGNTAKTVSELIMPVISDMGLSLWDVRFLKEGADWFLRVYIDKDNGINIEDCEAVSRAIDTLLDEADPISQSYCLEVCSPGIERELLKDEHFEAFLESGVLIKMIRPLEKVGKEFKGILKSADKSNITVMVEDYGDIIIPKKDTVYVKLDDFDA